MTNDFNDYQSRFSETVKKILTDTKLIASTIAIGPANTQHLLTALATTSGTIAFEALKELGVSFERISLFLAEKSIKISEDGPITNELRQVIKQSYKLAYTYKTPTVESEHLLLALVSKKDSLGYKLLKDLQANPSLLKDNLIDYFTHVQTSASNVPHPEPNPNEEINNPLGEIRERVPQKNKSAIDYFTVDITKQAKLKKLDPVVGREREIKRMIQILIRRQKNNPVLTGEPGVGKTAVVEGLAQKITNGDVPIQLLDKRILALDLALLISGTTYRGQFEERTKRLIDEIQKAGDVLLFVDEIHAIVGAGAAEGSIDLSNILKPALVRGNLRVIGATTNDEYRKYVEKDPALERRLQRVIVDEPTIDESIAILKGLKSAYEKHHNVAIDDEALVSAVEMSKRYISDRYLPDKAIDLIDEASAATQLENKQLKTSTQLIDLEKRSKQAKHEHQKAADSFDYQKAAEWRVLELKLEREIEELKQRLPKKSSPRVISRDDIARVVSMWTGIPVSNLIKTDKIRLTNLEKVLSKEIIGQDEAITTISSAIRRSSAGVADPKRPLGSFIFLGPTGVGKTELVKVLAKEVFGSESSLVKIDMSEFMEKHNVSRLVGAPPGYVGYDDAGKLTETVRRQPYSVILFDEIEKAHPDVFNMLLQIMEDGYLTDAKGRRVNFRNTVIIMTSNIGMTELNRQAEIGFKTKDSTSIEQRYERIKQEIQTKLKDHFRPEFLNRLDKVVVFKPLGPSEIKEIVNLQLTHLQERLAKEGVVITFEDSAREFIASKGYEPEFGARPIRRIIREFIETPLSDLILSTKSQKPISIKVLQRGEKLALVK